MKNAFFQTLKEALSSPDVQAPFQKLNEKLKDMNTVLSSPDVQARLTEWVRLLEAAQVWLEQAPEALKEALLDSMTLPHPELRLEQLGQVLDAHEKEGPGAAVAVVLRLNQELFEHAEFRKELQQRWQETNRWAVLEQVLASHDRGFYAVSIPPAIAQAEGVIATVIRGERPAQKVLNSEIKEHAQNDMAGGDELFGPCIADFVDGLFRHFSHGDAELPGLSRHAIMHGGATAYGTRENSIRALVWLDCVIMYGNDRRETPTP